MVWMKLIPNYKDDRCGGLITWAQRFAAKKWLFSNHLDVVAATGLLKPKMVRIGDGRSHFPAGSTHAPDRPRCRVPQFAYVSNGSRAGTQRPLIASQASRDRLASGRAGNTHMVFGNGRARNRPALQARGPVGSDAQQRAAGAGGAQLAGNRWRSGR